MKIMTFNTQHCLNFLTQKIDFELMANTIKRYNPDIVGLNEMYDKGPDHIAQVERLSQRTGIKNHCFARAIEVSGNPYGDGLLSKYPIVSWEVIRIPDAR